MCLALGLSCHRGGTTGAPTAAPPAQDTESANQIRALATEVPAVDSKPLLLPEEAWLAEVLGAAQDPHADAGTTLIAALDAFASAGAGGHPQMETLGPLLAATLAAEQAVEAGSGSVAVLEGLERAYATFDRPYLEFYAEGRQRGLHMFAEARTRAGVQITVEQMQRADAALLRVVRSAAVAHRGAAVALLLAFPDRPTTGDVLVRVASRLPPGHDLLAAKLVLAALDRASTHPRPAAEILGAAGVCYRALSVSCGDRAMAMVAGKAVADGTVVPVTEKQGALARRGLELIDRADLASRLEFGRTMMLLRRDEQARSIFETAHRQHPEDARPVTGLAQHLIMTRADFRGAYQIIERSEVIENRDRDYYQIAIVARAAALVNDVLPRAVEEQGGLGPALKTMAPYFARLREDVVAYKDLGGPEAEVVLFVLDVVQKIAPQLEDRAALRTTLRGLLPGALAVQASGPTDPAAYRLLLAAAAFSGDSKGALAMVRSEPSPLLLVGDTGVRRAQAWIDLAILWERFEELEGAERALMQAGPAQSDPRLAESHGVIAAVRARLGDRARWDDAAALFNAAAQVRPVPVVINNLGVALVELGRADEAVALWRQLGEVGTRDGLVELHDAIVARDPDRLTTIANGDDAELQLIATRWLVALAPTAAERAQALARVAVAEKAARDESLRPTLTPGPVGVVLKGEFNFNFHYEAQSGLDLGIGITTTPWLTLLPPAP